jgi:hypothetical protein
LLQKDFRHLCEKKYSKLGHPRAFLIQRIACLESNIARICSPAAAQGLLQQYRPIADKCQATVFSAKNFHPALITNPTPLGSAALKSNAACSP